MSKVSFSPLSEKCLVEAGWNPSRSIDITRITDVLQADGYIVYDSARNFLKSFGNLSLKYPNFRNPMVWDRCHFDAVMAAHNIFPERVQAWAYRIGFSVCPIGEASNDHITLVMAENGAIYGGYDDFLALVGVTPLEAVNALCEGEEWKEVTSPK